eukprot:2209384-Amphidinium_carterae.1
MQASNSIDSPFAVAHNSEEHTDHSISALKTAGSQTLQARPCHQCPCNYATMTMLRVLTMSPRPIGPDRELSGCVSSDETLSASHG